MIKKKLILTVIGILCFSLVYSQTSTEPETQDSKPESEVIAPESESGLGTVDAFYGEPQQYKTFQTISWKKISRAKRYDIVLQKKEKTDWVEVGKYSTEDTKLEFLIFPGDYRLSISVINVLGRVASKSGWVDFIVLDEKEPLFLDDKFELIEKYNSRSVPAVLADSETFTFDVFGKNIFFPETQFTLVPVKDKELTESDLFTSFGLNLKEVSLVSLSQDSEKGIVSVSCKSTELESGYYNLVVKNPSGDTDSIKILVLKQVAPKLSIANYPFNSRLGVPTVSLDKISKTRFTVKGFDFTPQTEFSLIPLEKTMDGKMYPFSSKMEKIPLSLEIYSVVSVSKENEVTLSLSADFQKLFTGLYSLQAKNPTQEAVSQEDLFIMKEVTKKGPRVDSVSISTSDSGDLVFDLKGKNLSVSGSCVLIKPFSILEESQQQKMTFVSVSDDNKTASYLLKNQTISNDTYAILYETEDGSCTLSITLKENGKVATKKYDSKKLDEYFLPASENEVVESTENETGSIWKFDFKGTLGLSGGLMSGSSDLFSSITTSSWFAQIDYRIFTFGWFGLSINTNFFPASLIFSFGSDIEFVFPIPGLKNYLTLVAATGISVRNYSNISSELAIPFKIGLNICKYCRIEYALTCFGLQNDYKYFEDSYRIGAEYKF